MYIDTLQIENYRCLRKLELSNLSPITILVGRNNTGKSALLEAATLISTAEVGWKDTLGNDLISSIIQRRGGWEYSNLMIRLGEKNAYIFGSGDQFKGKLGIWKDIDDVPESDASEMSEIFSNYINYILNTMRRYLLRSIPPRAREDREYREEIISRRELELETNIEKIRKMIWEKIKVLITYNDMAITKNDQNAIIIGEQPADIFEPYIRHGYIRTRDIIKTESIKESNTIFHLTPSTQYLTELKKSLAESGKLINLIQKLSEKIKYFRDLREIDNKYFVFLKGLQRPMPLESMGDGFRAKLAILAAIFTVENGLILMEEPEIRLHPGYLNSLADVIAETAIRGDAQYIISTHNLEFTEYMLSRSSDFINIVRMYRMKDTSQIDYEVLTGEEAIEEIEELKMDLRGI